MVTKTAQRGTAGAFAVIAVLLGSMIYNTYTGPDLLTIDDPAAIYVEDNLVYVGQEVNFYLKPVLLSAEYQIEYFLWDFHDGDFLYVSTRDDSSVSHTFNVAGQFLVSVMALRGNQSVIFTIPMTVLPEPQDVSISVDDTTVMEDEPVFMRVTANGEFTPIVNFIWEFQDGTTEVGQSVNHTYANEGVYSVRVRGFTNDTLVYTAFRDITVSNMVPDAQMLVQPSANEDSIVTFVLRRPHKLLQKHLE